MKSLHRVSQELSGTGIKAEMAFFSRKKSRPSYNIVTHLCPSVSKPFPLGKSQLRLAKRS
jgi:hypothetical protein